MLKASTARGAALLGAALTSACSGGGGGSPPPTFTAPPVISFSHAFPGGDALKGHGTAWDIVSVRTALTGQNPGGDGQSYDTLRVDITFAQDISSALPLPGSMLTGDGQLGVSIGYNVDGQRATGRYSFCDVAAVDKPFEFETDNVNRIVDGNYAIKGAGDVPIVNGPPNPQVEAQTVVSGNTLSQTVILGNLGVNAGAAVPHIGIAVLASNGYWGTDCVPGGSSEIYTDVPSLAS